MVGIVQSSEPAFYRGFCTLELSVQPSIRPEMAGASGYRTEDRGRRWGLANLRKPDKPLRIEQVRWSGGRVDVVGGWYAF